MSALSGYVHAFKGNYNRYGIIRKRDTDSKLNNQEISRQTEYWREKQEKIKTLFKEKTKMANKEDVFEQNAENEMSGLLGFMQKMQEANINQSNEKQLIFQKTLGESWEELMKFYDMDLSTGSVKLKTMGVKGLLSENIEVLKRLATNKFSMTWAGSTLKTKKLKDGKTYLDMSLFFRQMIKSIRDYSNKIQEKLARGFSKKDLQAMSGIYREVEESLQKIEQKMALLNQRKFGYTINSQLIVNGNKANLTNIDKDIRAIGKELVENYNKLKVPSESQVQGALMEAMTFVYYLNLQQGSRYAVQAVYDNLGKVFTSGNIKLEMDPDIAAQLKEVQTGHAVFSIQEGIGENIVDQIQNVTVGYIYDSQRKADIRLNLNVQEGSDNINQQIKNLGVSIKSYKTKNIHIVNGTNLFTLLFGGNFTYSEAWHLLNIYASSNKTKTSDVESSDEKIEDENSFASRIKNLKVIAGASLEAMILYSGLSGAGVGKELDNEAQYILLNIATSKKAPILVNIDKVINTILTTNSLYGNIVYDINKNNPSGNPFASLELNNDYVPVETNNPESRYHAASKRVAKILLDAHSKKISATIPRESIMKAANYLTF